MNESRQKRIPWHPLGNRVGSWQIRLDTAESPTGGTDLEQDAQFAKLLTIDQSESCGLRRNARVINL